MPEVELSGGTIEYRDSGGDGPVVVFLHGLTMNGSTWRHVVATLRADYRCICPTLPLGGHRIPMNRDADLSLRGMAALVGEFLAALDLTDVTLVQNDWGAAQILIALGDTDRIGRLVLTSSEAFDNYPPGPVRPLVPLARIPGGLALLMTGLRLTAIRRAPGSWGWMSKRPVPKAIMDDWFEPATRDPRIRYDLAKYITSVPRRAELLELAEPSASFDRPVLVVWATEDRMMPLAHGRRLADQFPQAKLVEIADSYTLLQEDQPDRLTAAIQDFLAA